MTEVVTHGVVVNAFVYVVVTTVELTVANKKRGVFEHYHFSIYLDYQGVPFLHAGLYNFQLSF